MSGERETGTLRLADLGEDEVVRRLTRGLPSGERVVAGPGEDDCAVIASSAEEELLLFKTDAVVRGVHYAEDVPPNLAGRKAMARCLSDIAAMGGRPSYALTTVVLGRETPLARLEALYRGLREMAGEHGVLIVGGETSGAPRDAIGMEMEMISVALLGTANRDTLVRRSGGRAGDLLYVSGQLGRSYSNGRHLEFEPRLREGRWLAEHGMATAMIDLSDGLSRDLPRLAAASGTGYNVEESLLPRAAGASVREALGDGEDYELLFAAPPERAKELEEGWQRRFPEVPLTAIGRLCGLEEGRDLPKGGWDHFA
ncbi:MAG TPA: thiamine-phosphate kinase [Verrucomicrobiales bacterium]|nr:thiamine-phosphate kinase [Verrucomicrobiales bacterium]